MKKSLLMPTQTLTQTMVLLLLLFAVSAPLASAKSTNFSPEKRQQLLAPIALYPDTVLTHILIAATYPIEVVEASRWAHEHSSLTGKSAVNAASGQDWDPSVKALLAFPDILARMSKDLLWTQTLGEAFLDSEGDTMDAVQQLRQQAWSNGQLNKMQNQKVVRTNNHIIIQPVHHQVVYIPYYDSRVVYGHWRWSAFPPVFWPHPRHYRGGFYWGFSAPVGDWFYFSGFRWSHRTVVISHHRRYYYGSHPRYGYRHNVHRWHHNTHHRRGVRYRNHYVRQRLHSPQHTVKPLHRHHFSGQIPKRSNTHAVQGPVDRRAPAASPTHRTRVVVGHTQRTSTARALRTPPKHQRIQRRIHNSPTASRHIQRRAASHHRAHIRRAPSMHSGGSRHSPVRR